MCLIAFAWHAHPDYPLIVAANRDEFFARPTASAAWWPGERMLAGRDLEAGGTWMGVTRDGRFAALTNHRDPASQRLDAPSRGALVGDFLTSEASSFATLRRIADDAARFNGFNLIAADWRTGVDPGMWIVSHPRSTGPLAIAGGVHGLSNARLDTAWPKVDRAVARMRDAIDMTEPSGPMIERLFAMLGDRERAPDERLPSTGVSLEIERALSAAFIRMPGAPSSYGTRASTVFVVDRAGRAIYVERRFEPDVPVEEQRFDFETVPWR